MDALDRIFTADDLIRGGACFDGVMRSASEEWPAAFTVREALVEARRRGEASTVRNALALDGYGYGSGSGYGYGYGYGYGDGYGDGDGNGDGYGDGYGNGNGNGYA